MEVHLLVIFCQKMHKKLQNLAIFHVKWQKIVKISAYGVVPLFRYFWHPRYLVKWDQKRNCAPKCAILRYTPQKFWFFASMKPKWGILKLENVVEMCYFSKFMWISNMFYLLTNHKLFSYQLEIIFKTFL